MLLPVLSGIGQYPPGQGGCMRPSKSFRVKILPIPLIESVPSVTDSIGFFGRGLGRFLVYVPKPWRERGLCFLTQRRTPTSQTFDQTGSH